MTTKIFTLLLFCFPFGAMAQKLWTLDDCIQYAKNNNLSIKQSELDVKATEVDKLQARGAFLPTLNGNMSYNFNEGKNINPVTNQFETTSFESASGGVGVELTLFAGLQNWRKLHQARLNRLAAQYQLDKMKDEIVLMIINVYAEILSYKEQLKNQKAQLEISQNSLKRTQDLIEAGILPKGDIFEAEAQLLSQEQQIIATENALFISKMGLSQLLLLEDYRNFELADLSFEQPSDEMLRKSPEEIYQHAKEKLGQVKLAEANVQIAQNSLSLAQSGRSPRVSAQWGYNTRWSKNQLQDFWQQLDNNKGMYAGLTLSVPIFNGFSTTANIKKQRIAILKAYFNRKQTDLTTEKNIFQAYNDAANAKKLYEASQKTIQAKAQAFAYAEERHNVGLMNTFNFSQAKYQYESAQNDLVKAKYQYVFKLKVLEYYFN